MMYRYGWDERTVGLTMAGVGVAAIVVQGGVIGPVVKRFGERRALIIGLGFGVAGFAVFGLAPSGPVSRALPGCRDTAGARHCGGAAGHEDSVTCSPDGAQRNPGRSSPRPMPFPDYAALHPGYTAPLLRPAE